MKGERGIVEAALIYVLAGVFVGVVAGSWKPLAMFRKAPPTAQLTELQAKLDAQQAAAVQAAKDAEAAKVAERGKLEAQVRSAQLDNLGAATALKKVPQANQTPEVILAGRMVDRTAYKLGAAIGKLPPDEQQGMVDLIEEMLSGKQSEIDEANRKLAALDEQFKAVTNEREAFKAQIPILQKQAQDLAQKAQETQAAVTAKTNEVKTWADKADSILRERGSLVSSLERAALWIGGLVAFWMFGLPAIVKHLASDNPFKPLLRDLNGYVLNPLTYHDAKTKLNKTKL